MRSLRLLMLVVLVAAGLVAGAGNAVAVRVPETLADRAPVQAGPVEVDFDIDYLGVLWDEHSGAGQAHDHAAAADAQVRFRRDGVWGPWTDLVEDGADAPGQWASGLVAAGDADAYQVRDVPGDAVRPRAVALNTTDGPTRRVAQRPADAAHAMPTCLSRAEWGAEEELRFDDNGDEIWPPEFYVPQVMTVHHTATTNDDPDPEATVRAIYRYHAVDRGWGDIGYQYLVDESGRVYEGRWSGETSTPCEDGGGADFAHETADADGDGTADELVTAAHAGGYNSGNVGVALLGEFEDHPVFGAEPKEAAVDSLVEVLADFAERHDLDPQATVTYSNPHPDSDATKVVDAISGHRDWVATECPGEPLYERLPEIRDAVAASMGDGSSGDDGSDGDTTATSMHVADLDASNSNEGPTWSAYVTVSVHDDTGDPVAGADVSGAWEVASGAGDGDCTTGTAGTCQVSWSGIAKRDGTATYTVTDVTHAELEYNADANAETSVTVTK